MHRSGAGHSREEIIQQVRTKEPTVKDYKSYFPIGNCVHKLKEWFKQGHEIVYLTSRTSKAEVADIQQVLADHNFPSGKLVFRKEGESYADVVVRVSPDVLIEDDCESIGGEPEMAYTNLNPEVKERVKHYPVQEFCGIGDLPSQL